MIYGYTTLTYDPYRKIMSIVSRKKKKQSENIYRPAVIVTNVELLNPAK